MRIVIDGTAGCGKTTFISCNFLDPVRKQCSANVFNLSLMGYKVFTEMVQESVEELKRIGEYPPNSVKRWNILFNIILRNGIKHYEEGANYNISWYDRGLPFLISFAKHNGQVLPKSIVDVVDKYRYDYVFAFDPIVSFDLSKDNNGKFRKLTVEDRLIDHESIIQSYEELGYEVVRVPLFSDNLTINFEKRLQFIGSFIPDLSLKEDK